MPSEPDPPRSRLTGRTRIEAQAATAATAQSQQAGAREFGSVEELLRADRAQVRPPARLERRVRESLAQAPPPRPWWRRWLRR